MGVSVVVRGLRLAAAGLGIAALATALVQSTGSVANFFSLLHGSRATSSRSWSSLGGAAWLTRRPRGWAYFRGAVTLYMVITGIVYALLLSDVDVQLTTMWVNEVLHEILPLFLLVRLARRPAVAPDPAAKALGWLAFPLLFLAYSLIRGPIAHFFPFPFLDPRPHGYDHVIGSGRAGDRDGPARAGGLADRHAALAAHRARPPASTMSNRT